uniref:LYR motif containing 4 n=1 Tax=Equus asinus TaxID=9793 RepID=A0A9L0IV65_EQUAS
ISLSPPARGQSTKTPPDGLYEEGGSVPRRRQPRSPALSPRGTLRLRPSAAPRAAPRRSLPGGRGGERKHLPLSCPGSACARLRVARRAAALLCRGSAPRKSEPAALVSIAAFAETEVWWVGLNSGPPRRGPVYFFSFQNGSLQPRTSVRPVPGDAEREQALQRLQLQVTRRAAGPGGRGRPGCREPLSRDGAREASPQEGCPCRHVWPPEASGEGQGACPWLYQRRRSDLVTLSAEWDPGVPALGACLVIGQTWTLQALRTYAVRRIRDAFRENKNVKDPVEIQALVNKAKRDLEIIRRQVHIGQLYSTDKLIIETQEKPRT